MYIKREIDDYLNLAFDGLRPKGLILAGVVGCGKTTAVTHFREQKESTHNFFSYSGDSIQFRNAVAADTRFIHLELEAKANKSKKSIVFVDEVQKSENIFDALKYAFDHSGTSFIVSGSQPGFLNSTARKRLQRRADFATLLPLSLPEILSHKKLIPNDAAHFFSTVIGQGELPSLPKFDLELSPDILIEIGRYLKLGGLPLAYLADPSSAMLEIRQTVERGILTFKEDAENMLDVLLVELARLHSIEFTYTNIFKRTGVTKRDRINDLLEDLTMQGYLICKKPYLGLEARKSYLRVYSMIDPGIVSYLLGETTLEGNIGQRVEGIVHTRLEYHRSFIPLKSDLYYFKPFRLDETKGIRFLPGEVDFVLQQGRRLIPFEVKSTDQISNIDTKLLKTFVKDHKLPFGVVLYKGLPTIQEKILYYPWWLV